MTAVLAALLPVFLLIVMGFGLRRYLMKEDAHWIGLERLVYFVLLPALLIETLSRANLSSVPIGGVGGALLLAVLIVSALCLALRPFLATTLGVDGPAFTSLFQSATRWQTFAALAIANNLYGDVGVALASVAMVAMIPILNVMCVAVLARYARPQRLAWPQMLLTIAQNPLIWACVIGLALNLTRLPVPGVAHDLADALGRSTLAIGLLVVGAGLQIGELIRPGVVAWLAVFSEARRHAGARRRSRPAVRPFRREPRRCRVLRVGAGCLQRLYSRQTDGRRRAPGCADPHAANDGRRADDADRDFTRAVEAAKRKGGRGAASLYYHITGSDCSWRRCGRRGS